MEPVHKPRPVQCSGRPGGLGVTKEATARANESSPKGIADDIESSAPPESDRVWRRTFQSRPAQVSVDVTLLVLAFVTAYLVRFDFAVPALEQHAALLQLPVVLALQLAGLYAAGVYSFIWRYIGLAEVAAFGKAAAWSFIPIVLMRLTLPNPLQAWRVPLSVSIIGTIFAFGGALGARIVRRIAYERFERARRQRKEGANACKPVLLVGAGRAGVLAAREILSHDMGLQVRGFVDDDPQKQGSVLHGVRVVGTTKDLPRLAKDLSIDQVVITIANPSPRDVRRIVRLCETIPLTARIIPGLPALIDGHGSVERVRDLNIEDVLGREQVYLDEDQVRGFLVGKTVLVTGAGGSIGSELARQVARFAPSKLLLVERSEPALFQVDRQLREMDRGFAVVPLIADVGDEERMRAIFTEYLPKVVIHAAAHKHVPLMEFNASEAVKNNVLATHMLATIAGEAGAEVFVLISTDKAVRPTSIMGASKRVAELAVLQVQADFATRYVAVRFGNVIGSAGSVIPIFRDQIAKGGPVTVTHRDMVRYFMTIPEAAQLALQSGAMGAGGEIFVLDMGEPVRILDVAKDMIYLAGLRPYEDVDIVFTGIRPGEKVFEELETTSENITNTRHPKIFIGKISGYQPSRVSTALRRFASLAREGRDEQIRALFAELLPESYLTLSNPDAKSPMFARPDADAASVDS
jgi:FlaA1/EpsC-like NDP-sugar epimerase